MHGLQALQSGNTRCIVDLEAVTIHVDIWNVAYKTYVWTRASIEIDVLYVLNVDGIYEVLGKSKRNV